MKFYLRRKAAPLRKNLFQNTDYFSGALPVNHIVFNGHDHGILSRKFCLSFSEDIKLNHTKLFKFHKNTVLIDLVQLLGRILGRKAVFFLDLHTNGAAGKQLFCNAFLHAVNIFFMYQPGTYNINTKRASVLWHGDFFHHDKFQKLFKLLTDM